MEEIAASFEAVGLPGGFHLASADLYKRLEGFKGGETPPALPQVTAMIRRAPRRKSAKSAPRKGKPAGAAKFKFGTAALKRDAAKRLRTLKRA
jgi:hypothetical protein